MNKSIPSGNVFLFEDDTAVRDAIAQSLELESFTVTAFESVESCSVRFGPDLDGVVVTDIRLPGADGRQLFRKLAEVDPDRALPCRQFGSGEACAQPHRWGRPADGARGPGARLRRLIGLDTNPVGHFLPLAACAMRGRQRPDKPPLVIGRSLAG